MDNPENLAILGTQDTRRRQTNKKKHNTICVKHRYVVAINPETKSFIGQSIVSHIYLCTVFFSLNILINLFVSFWSSNNKN
jgi:hypothetical protein